MFESRGGSGTGGDIPPGPVCEQPDAAFDALCQRVAEAVDALAADDPALLDFVGQVGRLRAVGQLIDRLEALRARLVAVAERSGALADDGSATAAAWLRRHSTLTASQASGRARIARRLLDLPVIAAAFAAGDVGVAHVVQIDRLCHDVGVDQVAAVQRELVAAATQLRDVGEFTRLCAGWRYALRPDLADAADDRAYDNRRLNLAATFDGVFHINGSLDAESGATLATAINAFMDHDPPGTPPELRRSIDQRRVDALRAVAEAALAAAPNVAGARPHIIVRVNLADLVSHPDHPDHHRLPGRPVAPPTLDWAGPIGPATLERLLSDSTVTRIIVDGDSRPLDVGTATRVWPAAIRKAITDRDRGCRFDPCDRPPEWCDIDHIIPVTEDGPTAVTNGILLCRYHHRAKRRDGWWPTLHPDATVTWTHADGRTRTDPPPSVIDGHVRTLLTAADTGVTDTAVTGDVGNDGYAAAGDDTAGYTYPTRGARRDSAEPITAGEARPTYNAQRAPPPTPHDTTSLHAHITHTHARTDGHQRRRASMRTSHARGSPATLAHAPRPGAPAARCTCSAPAAARCVTA